uniref:Uncharacterized protein n=1 Tax=Picea glauca TaxID=3330 RepID=A0A101LTQ1_PICGL|nr:hypothetical protein ABT39_MTgene3601 [Picea glauca]
MSRSSCCCRSNPPERYLPWVYELEKTCTKGPPATLGKTPITHANPPANLGQTNNTHASPLASLVKTPSDLIKGISNYTHAASPHN